MEQSKSLKIPIICENARCRNFHQLINVVSEVVADEMELFYEYYDGSEAADYCPVCGELGVAEEPILS